MPFVFEGEVLHCDGCALPAIAAEAGTPCYVYSASDILARFREYEDALSGMPHLVCYAVKANSNLSILRLLAGAGAGFDIVSGGELFRVIEAGGDPGKVVFSGVGKTEEEMEFGLRAGIRSFNCESEGEVEVLDRVAGRMGAGKARVAIRVNPEVDAKTHPYISTGMSEHKFGIDGAQVDAVYARASRLPNVELEGVSCHIGSQILSAAPLLEAVDRMIALVERLRAAGIGIRHLDLGGGLGVSYHAKETPPAIREVVDGIRQRVAGRDLEISVEPGRSIVAEAGVLLSRVLYRKSNSGKEFVILDAAMNDLIRPALYKSHHEIVPVVRDRSRFLINADIVGPVCETGDFLARGREIAELRPGELVAVMTAGAYGFAQASNYNSRPRAAEILVEGDRWRTVRARETMQDLIRGE